MPPSPNQYQYISAHGFSKAKSASTSILITVFYSANYFYVEHIIKHNVMKHLEVHSTAAALQVHTSTQNHNIQCSPGCFRALFLGLFSWYPLDLKLIFTLRKHNKSENFISRNEQYIILYAFEEYQCGSKRKREMKILELFYDVFYKILEITYNCLS